MATASLPEDTINPQTSAESWDVVYIDVFGVVRESPGHLTVTADDSIVLSCNEDKPVIMDTIRWVSNKTNDLTDSQDVTISFHNTENDSYGYIFFTVDKSSSQQCLAKLQKLVLLKFDASYADNECFPDVVTAIKAQPFFRERLEVSIQDVGSYSSSAEDKYSDYLVIADMECLTLFSKSQPQPEHQLFFWMTESPNTVEEVRLCFEQVIIISTRTKEYKFKAEDDFLLKIRKLTPKKKHLFTDCEAMMLEFGLKKKTQQPIKRRTEGASQIDTGNSEWSNFSAADRLKSELDAAVHTFKDNEDIQNYWISVEHDINELIESGQVPETDHMSGGLDSESTKHLEKCLSDIEDQFKENNIPVAISRLRACREQFKNSSVESIASLFYRDDMWLLKALYMKSLQS